MIFIDLIWSIRTIKLLEPVEKSFFMDWDTENILCLLLPTRPKSWLHNNIPKYLDKTKKELREEANTNFYPKRTLPKEGNSRCVLTSYFFFSVPGTQNEQVLILKIPPCSHLKLPSLDFQRKNILIQLIISMTSETNFFLVLSQWQTS